MSYVVFICGDTKLYTTICDIAIEEALAGHIAIKTTEIKEDMNMQIKSRLEILDLQKIDLAEKIIVVKQNNHINEKTQRTIEYARMRNKYIEHRNFKAQED